MDFNKKHGVKKCREEKTLLADQPEENDITQISIFDEINRDQNLATARIHAKHEQKREEEVTNGNRHYNRLSDLEKMEIKERNWGK